MQLDQLFSAGKGMAASSARLRIFLPNIYWKVDCSRLCSRAIQDAAVNAMLGFSLAAACEIRWTRADLMHS